MPPARAVSILGYALAVVYGLPSLGYMFGRDQGLFEYVGSGWIDGMLPYVDSWDQKPPGIHAVYALGALLFGREQWAIRVLELGAVLLQGAVFARLAAPDGREPVVRGGLVALAIASFHYTCFDYWHTGQAETWEALFAGLGALAARRATTLAGALGSGAMCGVALVFKLPALALVAMIAAAAWVGQGWRGVGAFAAGLAAALGLSVLPWVVTGTFATFWDVVIGYNMAYAVRKDENVLPPHMWFAGWSWPWVLALAGVTGWGLRAAAGRAGAEATRHGAAMCALAAAAFATVLTQAKYYGYHWLVVVPFFVAPAAWALDELVRGRAESGARAPMRAFGAVMALVALGWVTAPRWHQNPAWSWTKHTRSVVDRMSGELTREQYLAAFSARRMAGYVYVEIDEIAAAIRARAAPTSTLCARNYEPVFYTLTSLRCPSRFAAQFAFRDTEVKYRSAEWQAEYDAVMRTQPPDFLVAHAKKVRDLEVLASEGYAEFARTTHYVALQRGAPGPG